MEKKISLLIPFSSKDPIRVKAFTWLIDYWRNELPDCEIIIGESLSPIFCKEEALNNAVEKSIGDILVILDADVYLDGRIITHCAERIREELAYGHNLWYVPYRNLYRLRKEVTDLLYSSDPKMPLRFPSPPPLYLVENNGDKSEYGCLYGAMIMMFPRQAYETLGCFDERFVGWGGEDMAVLRALDTLFGKHKTIVNDIFHLWHPSTGDANLRMWDGQEAPDANLQLSIKYRIAMRKPSKMKELLEESYKFKKQKIC